MSDSTSVRLATTKFGQPQVTLYDVAKIQEDYGRHPPASSSISRPSRGDSSDCIPGVAGIGPKGAGELIQKFGSVQYIYDHLEELDIKPAMKQKLANSRDKRLIKLRFGHHPPGTPPSTRTSPTT